jgi:tetratricopeptide (TPR) repeat protein
MTKSVKEIIKDPLAAPLFLFVFAFALRIALVTTAKDFPLFQVPIMDMKYHDEWARTIIAGNFWGDEAFFRAPLYPYFLAFLYAISGGSITFARVFQAAVGAGSAAVCYFVGLEAFRKRRIAFLGSVLFAAIWTAIYFDVELLLVVLEVFFDLMAVLFLLKARDGKIVSFALAGLFVGLSAVARPNVLAFALAAWLIYLTAGQRIEKRKLIRGLVSFYAVIIAVILPVTIRNYVVGNDLILISSQGGLNLYIGNNPDSDGTTAVLPGTRADWWGGYYDAKTIAENATGHELKPSGVNNFYIKKSFDFFKNEPLKAGRLLLWKVYLFTNAVELGNNFDNNFLKEKLDLLRFDPVSLYVVLPFAFVGMAVSIGRFREYSPVYLFVFIYSATVVLFFVNDKFRMPIVPFLCLFAAAGFFWLWGKTASKDWKRLTPAILVLTALFIYCWIPPEGYSRDKNLAQAGATIGMLYQKLGRFEEAEKEMSAALEKDPYNPTALVFTGNLYLETDRKDDAAELYERALTINPNDVQALTNLGIYYTEKGDFDKAYDYFERSLDVNPKDAKTLYFLAKTLEADGRREEAVEKSRLSVQYEPNFKAGYVLLAELAEKSDDLNEAEKAYKALLEMNPEDPVGTLGLAQTLHKKGDFAKAEIYYVRYLDKYGPKATDVNIIKYNLACCLALQGKSDEALELLKEVIREDPARFKEYATEDPELESLRKRDDFKNLVGK